MDVKGKFRTGVTAGLLFFVYLQAGLCAYAKEAAFEKDGDVYLIQSAGDMHLLARLVNTGKEVEPGVAAHSASYRLNCDVDLSAYCKEEGGWEPIGYRNIYDESLDDILWEKDGESEDDGWVTYKETDAGYFNGTFDGDGHVIRGLYINRPNEQAQGLFGARVDLRGENRDSMDYKSRETTVIKNLYIEDCDVTGAYYTGGVMGGMWNFIQYEGGNLYIENCHVTGKIVGNGTAGGVVGSASTVKNSSFTGSVDASGAGGIAGESYYIYGCTAHAKVNGSCYVGGIGGEAVCVRNSYMTGTVAGYDRVGGITGAGACLTGCYTRADVTGYSRTGGLIGDIQSMNAPTPKEASSAAAIRNCLMGGYHMERAEKRNDLDVYYPTKDRYNGYIYGFPGAGLERSAVGAFYYREGLEVEGFGKGMYEFSAWNCRPYDCTRLEETDFKDLLDKSEEKWGDVWYCAADYAWPVLAWEKDSRFGYRVTVTVQEGDSLWKIAKKVYGNGNGWKEIYEQNKALIGEDEKLIFPGMDIDVTVGPSSAKYANGAGEWPAIL